VSSLSNFFPSLHHDIRQVQRASRRLPALPPCPQIGHRWPRPDALCGAVLTHDHHCHSLRPSLRLHINIYADDDHDYATDTSSPLRRGVEFETALLQVRRYTHDLRSYPLTQQSGNSVVCTIILIVTITAISANQSVQGITAQYTASQGLVRQILTFRSHSYPRLTHLHISLTVMMMPLITLGPEGYRQRFDGVTGVLPFTHAQGRRRRQEALTNQTLAEDQHQQSGGEVMHMQSDRWWWEIWHLGAVDDSRDRPPHFHPEPCSCSDKSDPYSPCSCATQPPTA
jgi:hypothetical protein